VAGLSNVRPSGGAQKARKVRRAWTSVDILPTGWPILLRFLARLRELWPSALLINICGALAGALQLIIPIASAQLINHAIPQKNTALLMRIVAVLAVSAAGAVCLAYAEARLACAFRERAVVKLQGTLFAHVQAQPYPFFQEHESGYILSRIINDVGSSVEIVSGLTTSGRTLVVLAGGAILLPTFDVSLGLLVLAILPVYCALLIRFRRKTREAFVKVSEATALTSRELFESLAGIYDTKACTAEEHRRQRFFEASNNRALYMIRARALTAGGAQMTHALTLIVSLAVIVWGSVEVMAGRLSLGNLVGINTTAAYLLGPASSVVQQFLGAQASMAAIQRVEEWMARVAEPTDRVLRHRRCRGDIRYERVNFSYVGRPPVLAGIDWNIRAGEVVLLSGASGAGKTTLVRLLPRFLSPASGKVYLDDVPVDQLPLPELRRQVGFVSQDTFLFSETVAENIRMGDVSISDADIHEACRLSNALEFIEALPLKLATKVGERGTQLSGGQRQRIAIARAIVRNTPVLILDEATSAVDPRTEAAVHEALCRLMRNRTTIIISHHSTSFIHEVDRCYVLEGGRVREAQAESFKNGAADAFRPAGRIASAKALSNGRQEFLDICGIRPDRGKG
jgi:ABC-type bacteriocin/lantibiotic exporter with double-glycine peptidase domain